MEYFELNGSKNNPAALPVVDPGVAGIPEEEKRVPDGPALVPVRRKAVRDRFALQGRTGDFS